MFSKSSRQQAKHTEILEEILDVYFITPERLIPYLQGMDREGVLKCFADILHRYATDVNSSGLRELFTLFKAGCKPTPGKLGYNGEDSEMKTNTIIVGDALEVLKTLPDDFFDVGVTSPPYNKGERHKGWLVDKVIYDKATDRKDEPEYQAEQIEVLNELYRVIKPGGSFFYNHKLRWDRGWLFHPYQWVSKTKWVVRQEVIWHRKIAGNIRGWRFWQVDERIYWLYKPKKGEENEPIGEELKPRHAKLTSVWEIRPEGKIDWAPDPFPLALPARCILAVMDDRKGRVIDPYAGSGTTLVVAKLLGHEFLGIEISEEYTERALERLANAEMERKRLTEEIELHRVELTFKQRKEMGMSAPRFPKQRKLL